MAGTDMLQRLEDYKFEDSPIYIARPVANKNEKEEKRRNKKTKQASYGGDTKQKKQRSPTSSVSHKHKTKHLNCKAQ